MATYKDAATWAAKAPWSTTKAYVENRVKVDMLEAFNAEHGTAWSMRASTMEAIRQAEDEEGVKGGWMKAFLKRPAPLEDM